MENSHKLDNIFHVLIICVHFGPKYDEKDFIVALWGILILSFLNIFNLNKFKNIDYMHYNLS